MTYYTILSDFDRDGRITGSSKELAGSKVFPGAILVPNLDVDPRALPSDGTLRPAVPVDFESDRRVRNEDDLTQVIIRKNAGAGRGVHTLLLRVIGAKARRLRIFTLGKGGRKLPLPDTGARAFVEHELPTIDSELTIYLEIDSFSGSLDIPADEARLSDCALELQLHRVEQGAVIADDHALFTIAPLLFLDNGESAKRVYMCDMPSQDGERGNEPSIHDFKEGMAKRNPKVPVILVPRSANGGDAWIQDQYQIGYVHDGSRATKRMVLHIPRLRTNVVLIDDRPNLAAFVSSHFPSQNVGVCSELWKQRAGTFTVPGSSSEQVLEFRDSFEIYVLYQNLATAWSALVRFDFYQRPWESGTRALAPLPLEGSRADQARFLRSLPPSVVAANLDAYTKAAIDEAERLDATLYSNELRLRLSRLDAKMERRLGAGNVLERVICHLRGGPREFTPARFDDSFFEMEAIHHSKNYGGNVEVIPASSRAPLGSILLGSKTSMNRPLVSFLEQQGVQPLVEIDTSWLGVGHVDEIVTFVRSPDQGSGSTCFHADTRLGHTILEVAFARYLQGVRKVLDAPFEGKVRQRKRTLDREEYNKVANGHMNIWDVQGDHIVTRLFRGKRWLHSRPPGAVAAVEPPRFYQMLPQTDYRSVEGDDKHYKAAINLQVFLDAVTDTNLAIQEQFIDPSLAVLAAEVENATFVPLPALFDTVLHASGPAGREYQWEESPTVAIVPGAANMQVVGNTLFIPRQYAARMRADDVIWVLRSIMPGQYHARLNKEIFKRAGLLEHPVWMHGPVALENDLLSIAVELQDGFWEHGTAEFDVFNEHLIEKAGKVQKLILARNRGAFTGKDRPMLKPGWHKLYIPENTVDLFEAYIQTVANYHGFDVCWVDTWYYHLRLGQIHCGTNVVRNPSPKRTSPWWDHKAR